MARGKFNIQAILLDAILRAGGDKTALQQVENSAVADKIAAILISSAQGLKPVPIIDGLQVFEIIVDGDDPRWSSKIESSMFDHYEAVIQSMDLPVKPGKRRVRYVVMPFLYVPTRKQFVSAIEYRNLTYPDRAVMVTIFEDCIQKNNRNWPFMAVVSETPI